ncbi:phosphate transporter [Streptomyces lunaelactis]|uniref:Phosphate transporter n=1 Tax=Streptomyces lunaelactis TaxID=1535768 RepID=A0A2R4SZJ1_9ACTN|nr:inorganic phosphate transporter [Streptomyces lunaelactis]AVZ72296.1 phosphate transporter [Streptomyces lunaelactis]NUK01932.1 inorganic phosphate transporter [Streptomyces lunaelactis]NUK12229.1 inorganic phosphate transporter [Streptomyces lunaelactis]NUK15922.1 inorganic phosphate transporter [Streptomyces lunaelactis]NUK23328.1 inorganic phosphate transporter [Streptomyces lunaelactis]
MEHITLLLAIVIVTALVFDFTNGFHDTANAMATTISTGALKPKTAVAMSAALNLVGAFLSVEVAKTISSGLVTEAGITPEVIFAALVGAILWNLMTWLIGLPSSSSHALMGGLIGATIASVGVSGVNGGTVVTKVLIPAIAAPLVAGIAAFLASRLTYKIGKNADEKATAKGYRTGQIASAGLVSLAHGTNDAQKTMGIITLALVAGGVLSPGSNPPMWVILSAGLAIAMGTYLGGWRIIRTMGKGLTDLQPQQGFAAQTSAASVILASSNLGFSLSTTHSCSGAVMGAGLGRKGGVVRWSTATRMFVAWGLTLPAAGLVAAGSEFVTKQGDWGVAAVAVFLIGACTAIWFVSRRQVVDHTNVNDVSADAEPAGVVTAAIAAVTPPPAGTPANDDLKTTIPAPAPAGSEPTQPATV